MQPLSKQNPVAVDSAVTGRVALPDSSQRYPGESLGVRARVREATERREWFWQELSRLADRWEYASHRLHRRWLAGELSRGELAGYVEEHDRLLVAIAEVSRRAAAKAEGLLAFTLEEHAGEQDAQLERWRRFAEALGWLPELGWYYAAEPNAATLECATTWLGDEHRPLAHDLLTLYAVQAPRAELVAAQLAALVRYYGLKDGPDTDYFRLHLGTDHRQAALARAAIGQHFTELDPFALLRAADAVYRAHWHMLEAI